VIISGGYDDEGSVSLLVLHARMVPWLLCGSVDEMNKKKEHGSIGLRNSWGLKP